MKTPCMGCAKREPGCHAGCPEYREWRAEWEKMKNSRPTKSDLSQSMKKHLWRRMLGR